MTDELDNVQQEQDDAPAKPAPNAAKTAPVDTTDWKAQYTNLQRTLDKKAQKLAETESRIETITEQYENQLSELRNGSKSATKQLEDLTLQHKTAAERLAQLEQREKVFNLLNTDEFANQPALRELHSKGALRLEGLDENAMTETLRTIAATITGVQATAAKQGVAGAVPQQPNGTQGRASATAADIRRQMDTMRAQGKLGSPEYEAVRESYFEAIKREGLHKQTPMYEDEDL